MSNSTIRTLGIGICTAILYGIMLTQHASADAICIGLAIMFHRLWSDSDNWTRNG